jgi:hypothetical protein
MILLTVEPEAKFVCVDAGITECVRQESGIWSLQYGATTRPQHPAKFPQGGGVVRDVF